MIEDRFDAFANGGKFPRHGGEVELAPGAIDFSVNTYFAPIPAEILQAVERGARPLGLYPDPEQRELREALAVLTGVDAPQVYGGSGASELIVGVVRAVDPRKALLIEPGFSGYRRTLEATKRCEILSYALDLDDLFELKENILEYLTPDLDIFFLTNPNNPTGRLVSKKLLLRIAERCEENRIAFVVDESFLRLAAPGDSMAQYVDEYRYLYVIDSFTKVFAAPALRVGFVVSAAENIERVREVLPEWNMSSEAQIYGKLFANYLASAERQYLIVENVAREREFLKSGLRKLGICVIPSDVNFLLCLPACDIYQKAKDKGVILRSCANFRGLDPRFVRISVRDCDDNALLVKTIRESLVGEGLALSGGPRLDNKACKKYGGPFVNVQDDGSPHAVSAPEIRRVAPADIETESFAIIKSELEEAHIELPPDQDLTTRRVIHTTADFDYVKTLKYSANAARVFADLIRKGAYIVTDTNMALAGINKTELAKYDSKALCFMADPDVAEEAKRRGVTRAVVSMERAAKLDRPVVFAIGNAPTALVRLCEMIEQNEFRPAFIVGVPVGFVNVVPSKERALKAGVPYIINVGRKGGSNVAAAICNSILYEMRKGAL